MVLSGVFALACLVALTDLGRNDLPLGGLVAGRGRGPASHALGKVLGQKTGGPALAKALLTAPVWNAAFIVAAGGIVGQILFDANPGLTADVLAGMTWRRAVLVAFALGCGLVCCGVGLARIRLGAVVLWAACAGAGVGFFGRDALVSLAN